MMKKLLFLTLFVLSTITISAQVYTYRTYQYAFKKTNSYGNWTSWSDWQKSDMLMTINFDTDVVKIYSPKTQTYNITEFLGNFTDNSGGKQVEFSFIDGDGDKGHMRLRIETNGNSQVYIEFSNIMWVYNVRRTN